jgi:hypothetical protein
MVEVKSRSGDLANVANKSHAAGAHKTPPTSLGDHADTKHLHVILWFRYESYLLHTRGARLTVDLTVYFVSGEFPCYRLEERTTIGRQNEYRFRKEE